MRQAEIHWPSGTSPTLAMPTTGPQARCACRALVLMVAITNFFNRINTTFRIPAGTRWD